MKLIYTFFISVVLSGVSGFKSVENRIVDEDGRERIFHGVNVVYKSAPYIPIIDHFDPKLSFSAEDAKLLLDLGLNVIRLGAQWAGVEPVKGRYDQEYINKLKEIVHFCEIHQIAVFLDFHQDNFSERFCGEGVPLWVTEADTSFPFPLKVEPFELNDKGIPSIDDCSKFSWPSYYGTYAASEAFDRLYRNENEIGDSFAQFWVKLAREFKGNNNIIAFELINEPWAGNFYEDISVMWPGYADKVKLQPFYDKVALEIRKEDPDRVLMFEGVTFAEEFGSRIFESGFEHPPAGIEYSAQSILSYHFYRIVNKGDPHKYFEARRRDMKRLNVAGFVSEFFPSVGDFELMDEYLQSWTAWEYKSFLPLMNQTDLTPVCTGCEPCLWTSTGELDEVSAYKFSRTYPQAIQGILKSFSFDDLTSIFSMKYQVDININGPTEIYFNEKLRYSDGFDLKIHYYNGCDSNVMTKKIEVKHLFPKKNILTIHATTVGEQHQEEELVLQAVIEDEPSPSCDETGLFIEVKIKPSLHSSIIEIENRLRGKK